MADLVTYVAEEAILTGSPNARTTYVAEEAILTGSPKGRITYFAVEVMMPVAVPAAAGPVIWLLVT